MREVSSAEIASALERLFIEANTELTAAVVERTAWPVMPVFEHLRRLGNISDDEMYRTFNMGIGMVLVVPLAKFKKVQSILERLGEKGYTIGRIVKGERKVVYS